VVVIERIETLADFQRLRPAWDRLYRADPESQFFLSWAWLNGVFEVVLAARDDTGEHLGFFPLARETVWSKTYQQLRSELQFAGRLFWADYGGFLCDPNRHDEVIDGFADALKQMHWSHLYLKGFRISDRRYSRFMAGLGDERLDLDARSSTINQGETDNLVCPYVELPSTFDNYLDDTLSSNTRQKIRRFLRKIESSHDYELATTSNGTRADDLAALETLWTAMWADDKGDDTAYLASRYRTIVARGLDDDLVHVMTLRHQGTVVGVLASFVDWERSRLLFFVTARDEGHRDVPVGLVLHAAAIRWAIDHGIATYDLMRGNEPYKYSLGALDTRVRYDCVSTASGINLYGVLDPAWIDEARAMATRYEQRGDDERARIAREQILAVTPSDLSAV
jgi:CelD/BcsL family acetyltransferase involved in cellulose biosynthesis